MGVPFKKKMIHAEPKEKEETQELSPRLRCLRNGFDGLARKARRHFIGKATRNPEDHFLPRLLYLLYSACKFFFDWPKTKSPGGFPRRASFGRSSR
jgi:hypothetical protein